MGNKIEIKVNGRAIALNPFVQRIIGNVVLGAVKSLDKVPQPMEKVEVILQIVDQQGGH
jgi:hypothetical protein